MSQSKESQRRSAQSGADPAVRGLILVVVAVVLGAILLAAGGAVGFDSDSKGVDVGDNGGDGSEITDTTAPADATTTEAPPVTVAPSKVTVVVANGAGISGLAGSAASFLATQGYSSATATDAVADAAATVVYYAEGFQPNAAALATLFSLPPEQVQPLPAEPVATNQPPDAAVVVVLGPDAEPVITATGITTTTRPG